MVDDSTYSIGPTDSRGTAWICATVVKTCLAGCAVLIGTTTNHTDVVETNVTQEAIIVQAASQHARATDAFLILGTCTVPCTRGCTHSILTHKSGRTVIILLTCGRNPITFHFGLTSEAIWAGAHFLMVRHVTDSIKTTCFLVTKISALTFDTCLSQATLLITLTWGSASSTNTDGVRGTVSIQLTGSYY